ncbi:MAG: XTP/dITP diphosphatase [Ruminococcaceae bacterium]|nr:XTP/dITP diphosphatase [Oscillospiraceae bacterium]
MSKRLVVATGNEGKVREIKSILSDFAVESAKEAGLVFDVEETGADFSENAAIKARALKDAAGCAVLADDSGLCVDALSGGPGVYTARYAGEHATDDENIDKLLSVMESVPEEERTARFVSAICLITEDGRELFGYGTCEGRILKERAGTGGFGYDPVFYAEEFGQSFGELSPEQKNQISHRKRALEDVKSKL